MRWLCENRWKGMGTLFILLLIAGSCFVYALYYHATHVLRVGIFAGSNWNVPAGDSYAVIDAAIQSFEAEHPGVSVRYVSGIKKEDYAEWLAKQILQGEEPDVFFILPDDFNLYASMGVLQNLSFLETEDSSFDSRAYYPPAIAYGQYEGESYALPFESVPTLMFVNKTLLRQEGITMPDNNWTWQDFINICREVTKDKDGDGILDQFGCYGYTWQQAAVTNGLQIFRSDGNVSYFANAKMEEVVRLLVDLRTVNHGYNVTARDFDMGKVAFRPFTFAEYRTYNPYPWRIKKYATFEWDCIKMPAGPSGKNLSQLDTLLIGMSARTDNKDLAWAFLKKLCVDPEIQKLILSKSQGLPVLKAVVESSDTRQILLKDAPGDAKMDTSILSDAMNEAVIAPKFRKYTSTMLMADNELRKIIENTVPLNNSLIKLQKEINAYLQY